jgi:hypothetical protein
MEEHEAGEGVGGQYESLVRNDVNPGKTEPPKDVKGFTKDNSKV